MIAKRGEQEPKILFGAIAWFSLTHYITHTHYNRNHTPSQQLSYLQRQGLCSSLTFNVSGSLIFPILNIAIFV